MESVGTYRSRVMAMITAVARHHALSLSASTAGNSAAIILARASIVVT
ncbi:hypothetical protein [Amycolatopsis rhizosphaerae]|nr:hypothetical protein [Amycolatopsis rhizosphaerae]